MYIPTSVASMESTLSSLPCVHDMLCNQGHAHSLFDGKKLKSCRTGLTNHTQSISHHVIPLVINVLGGGHKHTHICIHTNIQTKQFQ